MTGFVVSCQLLLLVRHHTGLLFGTNNNLDGGLFDFLHGNSLLILASRQQRRFIQQVFQIGTGKTGSGFGDGLQYHIRSQRLTFGVYLEDLFTTLDIGTSHNDLSVKTTRTHQSGIKNIGTVRSGNHDYAFIGTESVHLDQQLVQSLFTFIVTAAETGTTLTANRINFVNEDDAGGVLFGLLKQVTHTGCTNTDKHLHEIRTGDGVERHTRFTGHRSG